MDAVGIDSQHIDDVLSAVLAGRDNGIGLTASMTRVESLFGAVPPAIVPSIARVCQRMNGHDSTGVCFSHAAWQPTSQAMVKVDVMASQFLNQAFPMHPQLLVHRLAGLLDDDIGLHGKRRSSAAILNPWRVYIYLVAGKKFSKSINHNLTVVAFGGIIFQNGV